MRDLVLMIYHIINILKLFPLSLLLARKMLEFHFIYLATECVQQTVECATRHNLVFTHVISLLLNSVPLVLHAFSIRTHIRPLFTWKGRANKSRGILAKNWNWTPSTFWLCVHLASHALMNLVCVSLSPVEWNFTILHFQSPPFLLLKDLRFFAWRCNLFNWTSSNTI